MTVSLLAQTRIDEFVYRITFRSDRPTPVTFRVFEEGVLAETIVSDNGDGEYLITAMPGESPFVQILDRPTERPMLANPSRLTLNWRSVAGAESYRVDEYVSGAWTERASIPSGPSTFTWTTRRLEDVTTHRFRVVAIDAVGNDSTAREFDVLMVRIPDAPSTTLTYSAGTQKVTVS